MLFFNLREYMLIDPCEAEEKVMEGLFAVGMNQHKELSTLTMFGEISLARYQVCLWLFSFFMIFYCFLFPFIF